MQKFNYEIRVKVKHDNTRLIPSEVSGDLHFNGKFPFKNQGELLHSNLHAYIAGLAGALRLIRKHKHVNFDRVLGQVLSEIVDKVEKTDEELGFSGGITQDDLEDVNL